MPRELDLEVPSGLIHAELSGALDAPLTVAISGLSASLRSLDFLVERLGGPERRILAVDLRGRGLSPATEPGTYGWPAHAADVIAVADQVGASRFSVIGYSMGALVAMTMARLAPGRIDRAVFIDACSSLDPLALRYIRGVAERVDTVFPSVDAYLALLQQLGTIQPWSEYWDRYFGSELVPVQGGVRSRSDKDAVMEDELYGEAHESELPALWRHLDMPVLLVRAALPLIPGIGHIVPAEGRDAFLRAVPTATCVEIEADHYGVGTHEGTAAAIAAFLRGQVPTTTPPSTESTAPLTKEASSEAR